MRYRFIRFPEGKFKALTLSYDDGCLYDTKLVEIANKYGLKVTLNINSNMIAENENESRLTAKKIKEITESGGHEIAVHGANHIALAKATLVDGINDVLECRKSLERTFGGIIRGMAYADSGIRVSTSGVSKDEIKNYLKSLGIAYARTLGGDNDSFQLPTDFYEWMPTADHENPNLINYLDKFLNAEMPEYIASRTPLLFYLWGHSYEFNANNNWDLLEDFCQKAGAHDDIWYATNIEIFDYINAYRKLQFNVDNTVVYNPTTTDIWFEIDGKTVCVKSSQMKSL